MITELTTPLPAATSSVVQSAPAASAGRQGSLGRRVAVLLLAFAALIGLAGPASAFQTTSSSGQPGNVLPYQVTGRVDSTCSVSFCPQRKVFVPGPTVERSFSTSGQQKIQVTTRVHNWTSSGWVVEKSDTRAYWIYSSDMSTRPYNLTFVTTPGYKRVTFTVSWYNAGTGSWIGTRTTSMNGYDYACGTSNCSAGGGWVKLG